MKNSTICTLLLCSLTAWGQGDNQAEVVASERYVGSATLPLAQKFTEWNKAAPGTRPAGAPTSDLTLQSLLPTRRPYAFVAYIMDTRYDRSAALTSFAQQVAQGQLNKMVAGTSGGSGTTSLLSSSVAADFLSMATEYGAINQATSGNTTTLRGNLAGVAGFFEGDPYLGCVSLAVGTGCTAVSRLARGFSSSLSIETSVNSNSQTVSGTNAATGASATTSIFASGSRMSAWSARYDFQRKTVYDSNMVKNFAPQWASKMADVSASGTESELDAAIMNLMAQVTYGAWETSFIAALQNAPSGGLLETLRQQLDGVISVMASKDPQLMAKVQRAQFAIQASFLQRDAVLRDLQSNKFSVEFNSLHPVGQPNLSNIRAIYSYQPSKGSLLLTFNGAAEWYDSVPSGLTVGRLRDIQAAAQVDRQLGTIPQFGPAVLTVAFYYQWMRSPALITIPAGNTVPGTGIVLPGAASTLMAPSGPIDIGQVKLTLPIKNGMVKVPISFTWSNRTELINESEKRGQIGLTLDFDSIFKK